MDNHYELFRLPVIRSWGRKNRTDEYTVMRDESPKSERYHRNTAVTAPIICRCPPRLCTGVFEFITELRILTFPKFWVYTAPLANRIHFYRSPPFKNDRKYQVSRHKSKFQIHKSKFQNVRTLSRRLSRRSNQEIR